MYISAWDGTGSSSGPAFLFWGPDFRPRGRLRPRVFLRAFYALK